MFVSLTDHIKGLCRTLHLADINLQHPEKKLKEGKTVKCRVRKCERNFSLGNVSFFNSVIDYKGDYGNSICSSQLLFYYNVILPNEVMRLRKICHCIPLQNRATLNDPDFEDSLSFDFHGSISRTLRILLHRLLRLSRAL